MILKYEEEKGRKDANDWLMYLVVPTREAKQMEQEINNYYKYMAACPEIYKRSVDVLPNRDKKPFPWK